VDIVIVYNKKNIMKNFPSRTTSRAKRGEMLALMSSKLHTDQAESADSKGALQSGYDEAIKANWKLPQELKRAVQEGEHLWQQPCGVQHFREQISFSR